jgi:hypothetical protein
VARDVDFNYTASDKTGEAAASVERRMRKTGENVKRENDKLSNDFAKGIVALAGTVSPKLAESLTKGFASASDAGGPLLVAGIAAAAPLAGAALSAAIIGGAGAGGILGGVLIASKDPRVKAAFADMKQDIGNELTDAAQPFVQTTIDGVGDIGDAVKTIDFKDIFAVSAKNAKPIIAGISDAVRGLGDGVQDLVDNSAPVMQALGDSIGDLGQHAGQFFSTVAGGSDGAAAAVRDLTGAVDGALDVLGPTVRALTEVYGWLSKIGAAKQILENPLIAPFADLLSSGDDATGTLKLVHKGIDDVASAALTAGEPIETFTQQVDGLAQVGHSLFDSTTQVGEAIDRVSEAAKKNGKTLDENTAKGRTNREALSGLASALVAQYDATVKVNGEGTRSNAVAASNRAQFIKLAHQFGLSRTAAANLASQMGLIPAKKNTDFHANTHDADARIRALQGQINSLRGKSVSISVSIPAAQVRRVNNTLARLGGGNFDATGGFAFAAAGATAYTEPARTVHADTTIRNVIYLDGDRFRDYTDRQVTAAGKRDAWRQRVGKR